ncbi:MAG: hypothetical protein KF762_17305 [Acidobacteria bacterium]|nr:hypothetical protein [Acidobacteriota bacterium]
MYRKLVLVAALISGCSTFDASSANDAAWNSGKDLNGNFVENGMMNSRDIPTPGVRSETNVRPRIVNSVRPESKIDDKLEEAIRSRILKDDVVDTYYYYNRVDLDGDAQSEVIVFVFGEHQCGSGGCETLIFKEVKGTYELVTTLKPSRNPVVVSSTVTNDWKDLVFFNSGGGIDPGYYSICRFNGTGYPNNPTSKNDCPELQDLIRGTQYLAGSLRPNSGIRIRDGHRGH